MAPTPASKSPGRPLAEWIFSLTMYDRLTHQRMLQLVGGLERVSYFPQPDLGYVGMMIQSDNFIFCERAIGGAWVLGVAVTFQLKTLEKEKTMEKPSVALENVRGF